MLVADPSVSLLNTTFVFVHFDLSLSRIRINHDCPTLVKELLELISRNVLGQATRIDKRVHSSFKPLGFLLLLGALAFLSLLLLLLNLFFCQRLLFRLGSRLLWGRLTIGLWSNLCFDRKDLLLGWLFSLRCPSLSLWVKNSVCFLVDAVVIDPVLLILVRDFFHVVAFGPVIFFLVLRVLSFLLFFLRNVLAHFWVIHFIVAV